MWGRRLPIGGAGTAGHLKLRPPRARGPPVQRWRATGQPPSRRTNRTVRRRRVRRGARTPFRGTPGELRWPPGQPTQPVATGQDSRPVTTGQDSSAPFVPPMPAKPVAAGRAAGPGRGGDRGEGAGAATPRHPLLPAVWAPSEMVIRHMPARPTRRAKQRPRVPPDAPRTYRGPSRSAGITRVLVQEVSRRSWL